MALPMSIAEQRALLTSIAEIATLGRRATLGAWCFLLYDHLISLDREIQLIWLRPWNLAKCLYLLNRLTCPIFLCVHTLVFLNNDVTDRLCLFWYKFEGYTGVTTVCLVELILTFRVYALWKRSKRILAFVLFCLAGEIAAMASILGLTYRGMDAIANILPGVNYRVCVPTNIPPFFFAFWLPPLIFEGIVCALALMQGVTTFRLGSGNRGARLIDIVIRDSLLYFVFIFIVDLLCCIVWLRGPNALLQAVAAPGLAIPSVMASHLMLNLREAYAFNGQSTLETRGHEMHFYRSAIRRKTHTTFDTAWALDSGKDCPTSLSGSRSYQSPGILEEGSVQRPPLDVQSATEKADVTIQEMDTVEKPTSSLDSERGTHEASLLDKEAKSNEYGISQNMVAQED